MKIIKLKKTYLNLTLESLLTKLGLTNGTIAYPERLHLSKEDAKTLKKNIEKKFKKENPHISKKVLDTSVGMYWLNLGPSHLLSDAIRPGYAIIVNSENGQ